jgi:nucleoside-diphosphate-sugar epimerase
MLGWEPVVSLREGVVKTIEYFRTVLKALSTDGAMH